MLKPHLILASGSPRRKQLLAEAGYAFEIIRPAVDEDPGKCSNCGPAELVAELAFQKAEHVLTQLAADAARLRDLQAAEAIILAGDTVAECGGQILGKPRDEDDARAMLALMSGERHRVYSGVCLWPVRDAKVEPLVEVDITTLVMDPLSDEQLDAYLASGDWEGKAGAFGYQDGLDWVHIVQGSESNVVGLPMELLARMLDELRSTANHADERFLADAKLERSSVVANSAMNRSRVAVGVNSYERELGFDCIEFLRERSREKGSARWLDLCCGEGRALVEAAEQLRLENVHIVGVDLVAMLLNVPADLNDVELVQASLHHWQSPERYDLITCVHGLHYIGDKLDLLARVPEWLLPSGVFLANLDVASILDNSGHSLGKQVTTILRTAGWTVDRRKHLIRCNGPCPVRFEWRYVGADDQGGPNYTGQPAVDSYYSA